MILFDFYPASEIKSGYSLTKSWYWDMLYTSKEDYQILVD